MNKEYAYILGKVKDAAAAAIEYSPLNVSPMARELHTARLMEDFMTTIEVYLDENTPTDILNESTGD